MWWIKGEEDWVLHTISHCSELLSLHRETLLKVLRSADGISVPAIDFSGVQELFT